MKIVIIGGIAAGMSAAAKAKRTNPQAEILVIERENFISFGACGLPYYLSNKFTDEKQMFARTPGQMEDSGIRLFLRHEVQNINYNDKTLAVLNLENGEIMSIVYDRLMIATGATPRKLPNISPDIRNVFSLTKLIDANEIKNRLPQVKHITVIGGGFIGVEVAEQLRSLGKEITLLQRENYILQQPFDIEVSEKLQNGLVEAGIKVITQAEIKDFIIDQEKMEITSIELPNESIQTDLVITAIGFVPNTLFAKNDQLKMLENGAIIIDRYGKTSIPDVFAAGDCATIFHRVLEKPVYLPLATTANKMGRIIGENIVQEDEALFKSFIGTLGSSAIKAGKYEAGTTGLTEAQAKDHNIPYKTTLIETKNHTSYWPEAKKLIIKLIYHAETKVLLGAQIFGEEGAVLRLTGLSAAIHAQLTTETLGFLDFSYAPPFATTWEALNIAANTAK